ncbi:MAG TPA: NAD-dependent epimerase/dehydratase family protein [Mycobacteriales bacterium]|nr:NAD-dependent epimerase/dehydratase family protein [Mycobacteriales bacterium]
MRVLVTGGAGFIGSHVVDALLACGHRVAVIDDLSTGSERNLASALASGLDPDAVHRMDVTCPRARQVVLHFQPDALVLLAAQMSVKVSMRDPLLDATANVLGMVNMLEAARAARTRKVVFASSGGTIYGQVAESAIPIAEDAAKEPTSFYGLTKYMGTRYLRLYQDEYGLDSVALALGNVYGPRQSPDGEAGVVAIFSRLLLCGQDCIVNGDGMITRDYVYVSDVVDGFIRALDRGSGLINLGSGVETSVLEVYRTVASHVGTDQEAMYGPELPGETRRVCLDVTKARRDLGWAPRMSFPDGVKLVVDWLRGGAMR